MDFLAQYGLFLLKAITVVTSVLIIFAGIIALKRKPQPKLEITPLNQQYEETRQQMHRTILKTKDKKKKKEKKPSLYVLEFNGDIRASQVEQLRHEITAILSIATPKDEVVLNIDSPGGSVSGYGLAASQLQRLRDKHIPLTACIDKVAASGGYLMACVANKILAAPFAIIGSIGVVAQLPNFHRWLKKHNVDVELLTAGEYKRTLTMFGENTTKGREKFQEDLEKIHQAFRNYVLQNRQHINLEEVATGEHWLATDALALKLVDKLSTSDEYLSDKQDLFNLFKIKYKTNPTLIDKILKPALNFLHGWKMVL